jgi:hypothetical protein
MKRHLVFVALALVGAGCLAQTEQQPTQESPGAAKSVGYSSVPEALAALKAKAGVNVTTTKPDGWVIITEPTPAFAIWSFTPEGHYAHPAVVRRVIKQDSTGGVGVEMTALCQAEKEPCDRLIREFQQLNARMREQVRARMQQGKAQ